MDRKVRMLETAAVFLLAALASSMAFSQSSVQERVNVYVEGERHIIDTRTVKGERLVALDELARVFGASLLYDNARVNVIMEFRGRQAALSARESMVTLGDRIYLLSPAPQVIDGQLFVPQSFIIKILGNLYPGGVVHLPEDRAFVFGRGGPIWLTVSVEPGEKISTVRVQYRGNPRHQVSADRDGIWIVFPGQGPVKSDFRDKRVADGVIEQVSFEPYPGAGNGIRITCGPEYHLYRVRDFDDRHEFLVELFRRTAGEVSAPPTSAERPEAAGPDESRLTEGFIRKPGTSPLSEPRLLRSVVIDPGHGGEETGAVGPTGLLEKDVVLDIALKLSQLLRERAGLEVYLTRDRDRSLPLESRTALANHHKADLFISLHANASTAASARGSETYFLSASATDDQARNLAAMENLDFDGAAASQREQGGDDLRMILWDMAQTEFLQESSRLAESIQDELNRLLNTPNRGIKQAPFRVLMGATMPAVLVEVAFITNAQEEKQLLSDDFRQKVATALYRSILGFRQDYEAMVRGGESAAGF